MLLCYLKIRIFCKTVAKLLTSSLSRFYSRNKTIVKISCHGLFKETVSLDFQFRFVSSSREWRPLILLGSDPSKFMIRLFYIISYKIFQVFEDTGTRNRVGSKTQE